MKKRFPFILPRKEKIIPFILINMLTMALALAFLFGGMHVTAQAAAESETQDSVPEALQPQPNEVSAVPVFVTPESFGAVGDGKTDDTKAIQEAFNSGMPVILPPKTYLTISTLVISGKANITDTGSTIFYTGKAAAVRFTGINNGCDVSFGLIQAPNGSGIEFYCSSKQSRCQYINVRFHVIAAYNSCICFNRDGDGDTTECGWLNEIRISDGRFQSGKYGVYADAKGYNGINNIKFINVAFEGVMIGAYMANGCRAWSFINPRVVEMSGTGKRTFETEGTINGLNIIMSDRFRIEKCNFSVQTQGAVIAPIQGLDYNGNSRIVGNIGEIIDGVFYPYSQSTASLARFTNLSASDDINTILTPGNYCFQNSGITKKLTNSPTDAAFTMTVYYANGSSEYVAQEIRTVETNESFRRIYTKQDNAFSGWSRTLNEDDYELLLDELRELRDLIDDLSNDK